MTDPTTPVEPVPTPAPTPADPAPIPEEVPPVPEDLASLVAQMAALQAQVAQLNAEKGIPANPVEAALLNLVTHVKARAAQSAAWFSELLDAVKNLDNSVTSKQSDLARTVAADIPDHVEGAAYIKQLANNLHKNVLTA